MNLQNTVRHHDMAAINLKMLNDQIVSTDSILSNQIKMAMDLFLMSACAHSISMVLLTLLFKNVTNQHKDINQRILIDLGMIIKTDLVISTETFGMVTILFIALPMMMTWN